MEECLPSRWPRPSLRYGSPVFPEPTPPSGREREREREGLGGAGLSQLLTCWIVGTTSRSRGRNSCITPAAERERESRDTVGSLEPARPHLPSEEYRCSAVGTTSLPPFARIASSTSGIARTLHPSNAAERARIWSVLTLNDLSLSHLRLSILSSAHSCCYGYNTRKMRDEHSARMRRESAEQ